MLPPLVSAAAGVGVSVGEVVGLAETAPPASGVAVATGACVGLAGFGARLDAVAVGDADPSAAVAAVARVAVKVGLAWCVAAGGLWVGACVGVGFGVDAGVPGAGVLGPADPDSNRQPSTEPGAGL
ncbi:MAG: hypothetical protein JWR35_3380 [Marmoricola sp.]|nr:hypothetical protein [Marmoricola sp.]